MSLSKSQRTSIIVVIIVVLLAGAGAAAYYFLNKEEPKKQEQVQAKSEPEPEPEPTRWPLTGIEASSEETITRRPLSVKIENSPAARPQLGLQEADVVYETMVEGLITRFNAIYQSQLPVEVGPVRSVRLSDAEIVPQYNALFAFSGGATSVINAIDAVGLDTLSPNDNNTPYRRSNERSAPHNLYMNIAAAYQAAQTESYEVTATVNPLAFDFGGSEESSSTSSTPVAKVVVPITSLNVVTWTWDANKAQFIRANDGEPFIDQGTGNAIGATNVVVMWATYTPASMNKGSQTWAIDLLGSGKASIFTQGKRIDGTWKGAKDAPPTFTDTSGKEILLTPGNTWFEVCPQEVTIESS